MKKNTIWIIIIIVVLVVVGIFLIQKSPTSKESASQQGATSEESASQQGAVKKIVKAVGRPVLPGMSPINEEGYVVTSLGEPLDESAVPGSPYAPKQSRQLRETELPIDVIKLGVSSSGFEPNEFEIEKGMAVTLCVVSKEGEHRFRFEDSSLQGVIIEPETQSRCISFNAPSTKGDFSFYCSVEGHQARGETGVMHVK